MSLHTWPQIYNEFAVMYRDRIPANEDRTISIADIERGNATERPPRGLYAPQPKIPDEIPNCAISLVGVRTVVLRFMDSAVGKPNLQTFGHTLSDSLWFQQFKTLSASLRASVISQSQLLSVK